MENMLRAQAVAATEYGCEAKAIVYERQLIPHGLLRRSVRKDLSSI